MSSKISRIGKWKQTKQDCGQLPTVKGLIIHRFNVIKLKEPKVICKETEIRIENSHLKVIPKPQLT